MLLFDCKYKCNYLIAQVFVEKNLAFRESEEATAF
jgi:hypothetical protein